MTTDQRHRLQRELMERARANAERANERAPRRLAPSLVAMTLAVSIVTFVALGFDSFLSAMQRYLDVSLEEAQAPPPTAPLPVFAVDGDGQVVGADGQAVTSAAAGTGTPP